VANLTWLNYFNGVAAFIVISSIKGTLPLAVTLIAQLLSLSFSQVTGGSVWLDKKLWFFEV
jgi:hypothetical protein